MKGFTNIVLGLIFASIPAALLSYIWTGDLRWAATALLQAAFIVLVYIVGKNDKENQQ